MLDRRAVNADETSHGGDHPAHAVPGQEHVPPAAAVRAAAKAMDAMVHGGATWPHAANIGLGVWLMTGAAMMGTPDAAQRVSDLVSGALVVLLAVLSVSTSPFWKFWAPWGNSFVGVWLLFAPLVFWSGAAEYTNDTLVGTFVIVFAVLAPGMPGMRMLPGPDAPPCWSYNPSSWPQRAPIIALAAVGFFLSRHMTAFQLEHITSLPDPFFGSGTERVLTSEVSRAFPIPDAGLGAVAYMVEVLMGFMGDKARWRTMPWMVTFFGILVVPLGVVSITLMILQPVAVGAWCTPCLVAAAAMLVMVALTLDEVVAMGQFLVQARQEGQPLWEVFWAGGALHSTRATPAATVRRDVISAGALVWGVTLPWNLLVCIAAGIWLMFIPALFESTGTAAHNNHIVGALIVTVAAIALAEVGRATRFVNVLLGLWMIVAPWLIEGATTSAMWSDAVTGALVVALSLRRGPIRERYGLSARLIR